MYGTQPIAGIDRDAVALKRAKRVLPGVVQGDARYLPYANESFNAVTAICVVEHLPEIDRCLSEIARILKPGGVLIATVPSHEWKELFFWNRLLSMVGLKRWGRRLADAYDQELVHLNLLSRTEWKERFSHAGLELERIDGWLDQRTTGFVSFVDSVSALPFPFPGFWTEFGTHFFIIGVLKRLGGARWWNQRILSRITTMFERPACQGGKSGGYVLIVRKP
jgi:SAM-dependent methyltransferase